MRKVLVVLVAGWLAVSLIGVPGISLGQTKSPQASGGAAPPAGTEKSGPEMKAGEAKSLQGKIKSMAGNTVTLEDGTQLTLGEGARAHRAELRPGVTIKASFEDRGGQKVATSVEVMK